MQGRVGRDDEYLPLDEVPEYLLPVLSSEILKRPPFHRRRNTVIRHRHCIVLRSQPARCDESVPPFRWGSQYRGSTARSNRSPTHRSPRWARHREPAGGGPLGAEGYRPLRVRACHSLSPRSWPSRGLRPGLSAILEKSSYLEKKMHDSTGFDPLVTRMTRIASRPPVRLLRILRIAATTVAATTTGMINCALGRGERYPVLLRRAIPA